MPPSLRYINQSAPFWDFVASMENSEHPFFGNAPGTSENPQPQGPPWAQGPWGGRRGGPHGWWNHHNMAQRGGPSAAQDAAAEANESTNNRDSPDTIVNDEPEKEKDVNMEKGAIPDPPEDTPPEEGGCAGRRRCGGRRAGAREGGCAGRRGGRGWGGHHGGHPFHPYGGGAPRGGPWTGGWEGFAPRGFRMLSNMFGAQEQEGNNDSGDWAPEADVFDTPSAFVVHISLPGAAKEDIGVTWDPERSELQIAGVVHRPGDEELLKTLAMDERKVGAFERKIRLGTRAHPAQIDVDGISAKLENGILMVDVPKMLEEFVEVKKVDIE